MNKFNRQDLPTSACEAAGREASELSDLLCCHQCGSTPNEIDWSSVNEYYGISDQYADISCSGKNKEHCPVQVSINVDTNVQHDSKSIEAALAAAWNAINAT